jgi:lipopolysaccharide transport system permease protein
VGSLLLIVLVAANGIAPGWTILACPLVLAFGLATAAAATIWLSALNAIYRDIGYVVPFVLQVGFFLTPVVYETPDLVPAEWQWWFQLNPAAVTIEGFRWSLFGGGFLAGSAALASAVAVLSALLGALLYLRRAEGWVADRI